jgi:ribosomal protein S18 acetylase RimI-like enzyme
MGGPNTIESRIIISMIKFGAATIDDVPEIVRLLRDDDLGGTRENADLDTYLGAFREISQDSNQLLVVGREGTTVVSTLQLTVIPSLGRGGTKRAQIECVRVDSSTRSAGVGRKMLLWAIDEAVERGCGMVQATTDHRRRDALRFYESLGFTDTHHGLKLFP